MSGCCGGHCGCGTGCNCGTSCGGCKNSPDMETAATVGIKPMVLAAPSTKASAGGFLAATEGGSCDCNTCKCGTSCGCGCCCN